MRTVKVGLEADVADYIGGVLEADKATEKLDHDLKSLDKDLDKVKKDGVETAASLETLGGTAKKAGSDVDTLAKKTEEAGNSTKSMRARMDELEASLKTTGAEFARNGDPELLKKFKSDSSELKGLESMVGKMEKLGLNVKQLGLESQKAEGFFSSLQAGAEGGLTSPIGLGLAGIAAGPALAAAGGLALGGIGFLGAGAGVASAVMGNPQAFQTAWGAAAGEVKKDFLDAGNAFVGPTMKAIQSIGPLVDSWHLDKALAPAAKYLPAIVQGLEGAATGVEHGVADAIGKAGPAVQALSTGMKDLGEAAGTALSEIADGADGGAQALHDVLGVVSGIIIGFGAVVDAAEHAYSFIQDHPISLGIVTGGLSVPASLAMNALGNVSDGEKTLASVLPGTSLALQAQQNDFAELAKEINHTDLSADSLAENMTSKILNTTLSLDRATLGYDQSLVQLNSTLKQNGLQIDKHTHQIADNTEKGIANRSAVLAVVAANIQQYQANSAAGIKAEDAAKAYDDNTAALERNLKKAGLTAGQIDNLIGKYKNVPDKVNTDIAIFGLTAAIHDLEQTLKLIAGIHDKSATVSVTTVYHTKGHPNTGEGGTQVLAPGSAELYGGIRRAADGMLVPPSDPGTVLFGEPSTGGEAFIPLRGISSDRAMSLAKVVGDNYGFDVSARTRGMIAASNWSGSGGYSGPVAVTLQMAPGANLTPLGSLFNQMLRDGLFVVKASQVRAG